MKQENEIKKIKILSQDDEIKKLEKNLKVFQR